MSALGTQLLHRLEDALRKAPAPERAALAAALENYTTTYARSCRHGPPLLRSLFVAICEGAGEPDLMPKLDPADLRVYLTGDEQTFVRELYWSFRDADTPEEEAWARIQVELAGWARARGFAAADLHELVEEAEREGPSHPGARGD